MADEVVKDSSNSAGPGVSPARPQRIFPREIEEEMRSSYLDYAMSVIVSRALPDVRDGLKPVQRRILYAMNEMGLHSGKPFKKSARIVGEVLGKYHPHGDVAIYDAMVRMAQDFSLRYPLVQGQGNFGSVDGDSPAALRYTEARLSKLAEEMLADIDRETVDFVPNFDSSTSEPVVLPSRIPNLLINGSSGIAVGMATSIPPHNVGEVIDAVVMYLDNSSIAVDELLKAVKGPDFPTGAIITGKGGIREAYSTGRGSVIVRSRAAVEQHHGRNRLIVTEIPYMVNKSQLVEEIADLVRDKKVVGISDLRDESNREGMRVVIELKKEADTDVVLRQLYAHSRLESSFSINIVALVRNQPRTLNLRELVEHFANHRIEVVRRRTEFDLRKATERAHILEGLIIALNRIDFVIKQIRASKDAEQARAVLIKELSISVKQAEAILDMRLQRLASLEQQKIRAEHSETLALIKKLRSILSSQQEIVRIIREELLELRKKYADARRTEIIEAADEFEEKELVPEEEVVVTVTRRGYIKRMPVDAYRMQRRGGKGIVAAEAKEEDFVEKLFPAQTRDYMLFFTSKGIVHWLEVYRIPEASRYSAGKAIVNLLEVGQDESIAALMTVGKFDDDHYLLMCTRNGIVKKTNLSEYSRPRKGGIIAINLEKDDALINAEVTDGISDIILATRNGRALKFNEKDVRSVGRNSIGVRGIRLAQADSVIGMVVAEKSSLLTVTEKGYGKASPVEDYRFTARGGKGVRNIKATEKNGKAVAVMCIGGDEGLMFITRNGITIRVSAADIPVIGRNTQGVRIMKLEEGDAVVGAALVSATVEGENHGEEPP